MSKHFRVAARLPVKLEELGVSVPAILRRAGLPAALFGEPRVLLTTEELFSFWRAVTEISTDPALGLLLGTETRVEHFDPIALTALSSSSFGEAMRQTARYKQLACPEEILHHTKDGEWSIQFRWLLADDIEPEMLTDLCFAWVLTIARHGTATNMSPVRVEFARPRQYRKSLERHFGCPVVFGGSRDAIVFRATDADRPFVTNNAELLAMLAPQLEQELERNKGEETFPEHVRAAIQKRLTGRRPKMQEIARELHISSRTLQRRLQEDGLSFQQVLAEASHQMARHYLANPGLELNEAAYLLGYEDANSFVRAFRLWEGIPPAHWRESQWAKGQLTANS
ncbi:MAG TPA: AraC family transcriptional regulator [Acidobacteriaceae bacterium]|jgi:AraC-like DNA-binding protein